MKMLTCSRLNSYFISPVQWLIKVVAVLWVAGDISAQAQQLDQSQNQPESAKAPIKWVQAKDLPVEATETDNAKEKSSVVSTALKWWRSTDRPGDLQIHGFVTQAYILTSDNNVFGNSEKGGNFGLTEAGLNASVRPLPKLQLSAQVLSRRAGEGSTGTPRLDFAFLDYRLYSHETNQFGVRVGRLKNPFGFYNDTRDVAFTRPGILLPQSIYFDRTRNLGLSGDSVQLYGETAVARLGTISTQFGAWLPIVSDKDTQFSILGARPAGQLNREVSYIGRGIFETNDKRLRLGISGIWLNTSYDPSNKSHDPLGPGAFQFTPIYFSAQYNTERWTLTSEYAIRHLKYDHNFHSKSLDGINLYGESYYFQGEYRFTPRVEGIVRYDVLYTDRSDRSGNHWAARTGLHGLEHTRFAKDITVGMRWNVTPEFMLRAEYHHVNGTGWLSRLDNPSPRDTVKNWDLFAIQASYRF
ncbi:MAG: hypothetical protein KGN35_00870 [Betaproteobacteria bacterium]|nr:hypothetical protein [Betaproteobacteria bacterium]